MSGCTGGRSASDRRRHRRRAADRRDDDRAHRPRRLDRGGGRGTGLSLGLSRLQVMRLVVLPQTTPFLIPPLLNTFIGLLKTATIASAVGAPEILYRGQAIISRSGIIIPVALSVIGLYVVVTW